VSGALEMPLLAACLLKLMAGLYLSGLDANSFLTFFDIWA
jgi:hypothetical protein